ncbi:hypothetical protein [Escherichia coli]|nr:hypothetical protein [Escherichia coli]
MSWFTVNRNLLNRQAGCIVGQDTPCLLTHPANNGTGNRFAIRCTS